MPIGLSTIKSRRLQSRFLQAHLPETTSESEGSVEDSVDERRPPDVEPGVEVEDDITIPLITLPPGIQVSSYSAVVRHLKQSKFIFDAFHNKFGMTSYCICSYWLRGW